MNRLAIISRLILLTSSTGFAADAPTVWLHSAGSLRAAMTDIAAAYSSAYGARPPGDVKDCSRHAAEAGY
jgi:ABC-type molybdate transport system substrate-binding protein